MLRNYINTLKDLLFPRLCFSCNRKILKGYICQECRDKIEFLPQNTCCICARPLIKNQISKCHNCHTKNSVYSKVISAIKYKDPIIPLIKAYKYYNCDFLSTMFSSIMIDHLKNTKFNGFDYDIITSVPLHPIRKKERGYNQASLLAKKLAKYFKIPFKNDIIYEAKNKPSQTKLAQNQRDKNVTGAFLVKTDLKDKRVILIDDIFTTGATAQSCCLALKEKGAKEIIVITLCRAQ